MNVRERFQLILNGKMPNDRIPMIEYAPWWTATIKRWENEGLPHGLKWEQITQYFNLDETHLIYCAPNIPPAKNHGKAVIKNEDDYERIIKENVTIQSK